MSSRTVQILALLTTVLGSMAFAQTKGPMESVPKEPLRIEITSDMDTTLKLFATPRFGVMALTDGFVCKEKLDEVFRKHSLDELVATIESRGAIQKGSLEKQNGAVVLNVMDAAIKLDLARKKITQKAVRENRKVTDEELKKVAHDYLVLIIEAASHFDRLSTQGCRAAVLNLLSITEHCERFEQADSMNPGSNNLRNDFSRWKLTLPNQQILKKLVTDKPQMEQKVAEMVTKGYWPAIEFQMRRKIAAFEDYHEIRSLAEQLVDQRNADAIANGFSADILLKISRQKNEPLSEKIEAAARQAISLGLNTGYLQLFNYYVEKRDVANAQAALEQGSEANERFCNFKLAFVRYSEERYEEARKLFQKAMELGVPEATVYLGMMFETGQGGPKNFKQAIEIYRRGARSNVAAAMERMGIFYALNRVQAPVPDLEYQIEGVPRLPEPTFEQKQVLANLTMAQLLFEKAAHVYKSRKENENAQRVTRLGALAEAQAKEINASIFQLDSTRLERWQEWDNRRLDRSFERQIERRNEYRREIERRNRRDDRIFNQG